LSHNITCIGTLQSNKKGIPTEIKQINEREEFSYKYFWESEQKKLVLHSYVVKTKSTGLRNVLMLSSLPPLLGTVKNDRKRKPAIYKVYDFTKGGTDIVDQRMANYSCKTKSIKWTLTAFSYVLDTCRVNAATVFTLNMKQDPRKQNSFKFGWDLAMDLILPEIHRRPLTGLNSVIRSKISIVLGTPCSTITSSLTKKKSFPNKSLSRRRCGFCCSELAGPGQKKRRNR